MPVLLLIFVCAWMGWHRGRPYKWLKPVIQALLIVVSFFLLLIPANVMVFRLARNEAMDFPDLISPQLEEHKVKHGAYPLALNELPNSPALPRMMSAASYRSDGLSYSFSFADSSSLMGSYSFESSSMEWESEY